MNLLEIIQNLHGLKAGECRHRLIEWGVDSALWPHIQKCFTREGRFQEESKKAIRAIIEKACK